MAMEPMDAAAAQGQIALQRCGVCDLAQYPPRELCRGCLSADLVWRVSDDLAGEVLATTVSHHSFAGPRDPVRVGLVQLEAGATALCFVPTAEVGSRVRITAALDPAGRAVMTAVQGA